MSDSESEICELTRTKPAKNHEKRLIVILEGASLETVLIDKKYQLLNCDKHKNFAKKNNRDITDCRPDITHQCLLMLLDSPLNRAGLLQVFIRTEKNVLIEISPETRIPRTFERFCEVIVQLLQEHNIFGQGKTKLLKLIKNPVTKYLPSGCMKISTSFTGEVVSDPSTLSNDDSPIVFVIGAFAKGNINVDYAEKTISMSGYPLSAALACTKLCNSFERKWGII